MLNSALFNAASNTLGRHPSQHLLRLYHVALENRDLLTVLSAGKAYSIPEDVKDTINIYPQVFILSPSILGYKKKTGPATVLATLRAQGVSSIPPEHDQGRAQVVLKTITKALTDARHQIKYEIQSSLEIFKKYGKGAPGADIASLAEACIGSAKTKATLGLFMRVAFLNNLHFFFAQNLRDRVTSPSPVPAVAESARLSMPSNTQSGLVAPCHESQASFTSKKSACCSANDCNVVIKHWVMTEYPDKVARFWDEVDTRLDEIRRTQKTATEREAAAQLVYDEDVEKYGPPNPECPPTLPDRLDDWIKTVNRYAGASSNAPIL